MEHPANQRLTALTIRLVAGAILTLIVTASYAAYTLYAVDRARRVQVDLVDRNRKASLQLVRIQADLNALGLAMRDMIDNTAGYPMTAWRGQLNRIQDNLTDALRIEEGLSSSFRDPRQGAYLRSTMEDFWRVSTTIFVQAAAGHDAQARKSVRESLQPRLETLSALVSRLLVANHEEEETAASQIRTFYEGLERNAYIFLAASLLLIVAISAILIRNSRAMFRRIDALASERRELAQQLIASQESTLRGISRDLHDEFGQILTALGAMLQRARRHAPDGEFVRDIEESRQVVQDTLDKVRGLSQSLQPMILEEQGLAAAIPWQLSVFERQTGIAARHECAEPIPELATASAVHVFRIVQEALNNVARHAEASTVLVRTGTKGGTLRIEVEDDGKGIGPANSRGMGMAGMRERAELLGGGLSFATRADGTGTRLMLEVPIA